MHSVGIMIYGNAEFNGIPWEIIITQYKKSISSSVLILWKNTRIIL